MAINWDTHWEERREPQENSEGRTSYERDYARVVHSASFRRLQAKTQVLGVGDSDFYRTRLTHSMEVSQIGAAITKKLYRKSPEGCEIRSILPPPMLMRTICLSHDLGHPPFGHGGEVALNRCMLGHGGFEGNGQTLRIMARLEPYHQTYGMNLTRRSLLGVLKYPAPHNKVVVPEAYPKEANSSVSVFEAGPFKPPKCYFDDEIEVVNWVAEGLTDWEKFSTEFEPLDPTKVKHRKPVHKSLDTSIMEIADDIAYGIHDLEDGISLKLIVRDDLATDKVKEWLAPFVDAHHDNDHQSFIEQLFSSKTHERKNVIGSLVGYCIKHVDVAEPLSDFEHPLLAYRAKLAEPAWPVREALQKVVIAKVIRSTTVQQLEFKGQKIVTELFHAFQTDPKRLLPTRDASNYGDASDDKQKLRIICDYIAGMTDEYATKRYEQLFTPRAGSVFDRL